MSNDDRIPVRLGTVGSAGPRSHVLLEADLSAATPFSRHSPNCVCCAPRGALARALSRLFVAQVRGEVAPFDEVVVVGRFDQIGLATAIREDVVAAARFRLA